MKVAISELLGCMTQCAGDLPFLALDAQGRCLASSPGADALFGTELQIDGRRYQMTEAGISPGIPSQAVRDGAEVQAISPQGERRYQLQGFGLPDSSPELWLMRFDPADPNAPAREPGLPIRPAAEHSDAVLFHGMWARSPAMRECFRLIRRIAPTDTTVLIRGESGTGKEHVARAIHQLSPRAPGPFIAVNCAALVPSLLESELFGHVKGAFTGALSNRQGLFEQANGGTIFLDEVAEMSLKLQATLLRVIEERVLTPVGSTQSRPVDVRILSATHRSLRDAVAEGSFREDLMFRLRVVPLFIPALRDRRGDLELLISYYALELAGQERHSFSRVHPDAMRALLDHPWRGNVRELRNVIEYASVVSHGKLLTLGDLPPEFREDQVQASPPETAPPAQSERSLLHQALLEAGGHKGRAAEALGMHRTTLWRKLKQYDLC